MAIADVAQAAYNVFPMDTIQTPYGSFSLPVVMTAIAGAEDSFRNGPGDYHAPNIPSAWCNGYGSFGAWQINLYYNGDEVAQLSGIPKSNPCGQANWLMASYTNCAKVALLAYQNRGLKDWCTWWGDALCGTQGGQPGYGPYQQYLNQAQTAIDAVTQSASSTTQPPYYVPPLSKALLWGGLGLAGIGVIILGYELWSSSRRPVQGFARRRNDDGHTDAKIDPQWLTFIKTTDKEVAEIAKPLSACDAYKNLLAATERAGVKVLTNRNLPEGVNAMYLPPNPDLPQMPEGQIMLSAATTQGAKECNPYDVQTVAHEDDHYLTHKPGCMPHFRGVQYSSEGHQIEEREAELASFAFMVESGLPVETYEGTYYPAGTEEIDWGLAKRNLHPDTYENVKWATGLLVRAGQGDVDAFVGATCPFARKSA